MASLNIASDRTSSTLVLPQVTLRDLGQDQGAAPGHPERRCCVLLRPERGTLGQTGLHMCSISGGKKGGHSGGAVTRANLESSGGRVRRAVRDKENEGKRNGRRWIKTEEKEDKE